VQNIAEGSQASGTSKKTEMKLTSVARASLEELRLDYEDYLRHRKLELWQKNDMRRKKLIDQRCNSADEVARWVKVCHNQFGHGGLNRQVGQSAESIPSNKSTMPVPLPMQPLF
jgi:hypothetical protein